MKSRICIVLLLALCLLLSACGLGPKLVGQWEGDGTLEVRGGETPFDHAVGWVFREDGTGTVTTPEGTVAFDYRTTDDTLTLDFGEISHGFQVSVRGDRFTAELGRDVYTFTRVK